MQEIEELLDKLVLHVHSCIEWNGELKYSDTQLDKAAILKAFAEKDKRIAELEAQVNDLKAFAIWMTGCGYDFTQHQYFIDQRDKLFKSDNQTKEERG